MRPCDEQAAARLAAELIIPLPIARLLIGRKISDPAAARMFLHGTLDDLHDPFLLGGMNEAVERIFRAVEGGERILIFGDYDVDGVLSVVMLRETLKSLNAHVDHFIPERLKDGYGIKDEHIGVAVERGAKLIISVDCGIKSNGFVRAAREKGIDVIITDHHLPGPELPEALAVLDPVLDGSGYPDRNLAGVGVAFKLIQALQERAQMDPQKKSELVRSYIKLVSIGTVSDVAKLTGENRILVKYGLRELSGRRHRNHGLNCLIDVAGLTGKKITEADIGFRLGPRINAAGRMKSADDAVNLFFSESPEAARLAAELDRHNAQRQSAEKRIYDQACARIEKGGLDKKHKILILGCPDWHRGIIGIVASKLKEDYGRPVILFACDDGTAYGSGRSIPEFSLINCLYECRNLFLTYGGHELAAGCTLRLEDLPGFKSKANGVAEANISDEDLRRKIVIDAKLDFGEIDPPFLEHLELLAPFGVGNPRPVFFSEEVEVVGPPRMLKGKYAKFLFRQGGRTIEGIGWDKSSWDPLVKAGDRVQAAFSPQISTYLGLEQLTLKLAGMKSGVQK